MMDLSLNGILRFLHAFGYLRLPNESDDAGYRGTEPAGKLGSWTEDAKVALAKYQRWHGLPVNGWMEDDAVLAHMCQRRCGHPDKPYAMVSEPQTLKWNKNHLTWKFVNYTLDIPQHLISDSFNKGFGVWSQVTPLVFQEVLADEKADIQITFKRLDTQGQVLAQAWFPPVGTMEFDESEVWSWQLPIGRGAVDLATVVAHESGHTIGLNHSNVQGSQMAPVYAGPKRFLERDDIQRAQALYGSK